MSEQRLGKGLAALIDSKEIDNSSSAYREKFDIERISPNPYQPRMHIDTDELINIADSIREHGVIQPLIITKDKSSDNYFIIAGERRYRASQLAGLKYLPVVIKESSPQEMLELALIENIQRKDLNPLEEANSFLQLQDEFGLSQDDIAQRVGLNRVTVANKIRLIKLPDQVKEVILNETISEGHARALLGIRSTESLIAATDIVVKRGLSVRQTEALVRKINYLKTSRNRDFKTSDERTEQYAKALAKMIDHSVSIKKMSKGGRIVIRYITNTELDKIIEKLGVKVELGD
jgi:ParB family chromosome partitioning protein